jgi:hypothetical protein
MSLFGRISSFVSSTAVPCKINIKIKSDYKPIYYEDKNDSFGNLPQEFSVLHQEDSVTGQVFIVPEKTFDHGGIKIELIGEIGKFLTFPTFSSLPRRKTNFSFYKSFKRINATWYN